MDGAQTTASALKVAQSGMARKFHIDPYRSASVVLAFLFTVAVLLLVAARPRDIFVQGRVYLAGFAIVCVASVGNAMLSIEAFLFSCRVGQAVGFSLILSTAPALFTQSAPPYRRRAIRKVMPTTVYLGMFYAMAIVSTIVLGITVQVIPTTKPERQPFRSRPSTARWCSRTHPSSHMLYGDQLAMNTPRNVRPLR